MERRRSESSVFELATGLLASVDIRHFDIPVGNPLHEILSMAVIKRPYLAQAVRLAIGCIDAF
jgi:hypothetical protein